MHLMFARLLALFIGLPILCGVAQAGIVAAEYYLGTDPGEGNGTAMVVTPVGVTGADLEEVVLNLNLAAGVYDLGVRVQDDQGRWSNPLIRRISVRG